MLRKTTGGGNKWGIYRKWGWKPESGQRNEKYPSWVKIHWRNMVAKVSDWVNFHHLASEDSCSLTPTYRPGSIYLLNLAVLQQRIWLEVCSMDVRQVSAQKLALPSSDITSFSLMVWATCPVLMHALQTGWVSCQTGKSGFLWPDVGFGVLFTAKLKSNGASQSTPCNAINYITSWTDLTCEVWMHLTLSSKSSSSTSPWFGGGKVS